MKKNSTLAAIAAAMLATSVAATGTMAAGFRLPEAGAKAMGMGFAFTAQADDPSAIYYNPAGITQLEGNNAMAGVTAVRENGGKFAGTTPLSGGAGITETQKTLDFFIPNAYATHKTKGSAVAWGIGVFTPFGLGQEYKDKGTSFFRNQATRIDLKTVVINPTVAFKIGDALSVGVGIDYMMGWANLEKFAVGGTGTNLAYSKLKGDGDAWGYNAGILLTPSPYWQAGFSYRSPFDLKAKDADLTLSQNLTPFPVSSKADAVISMPATAALGIAIRPVDRLTVEADLDWTFWSAYRELNVVNRTVPQLSSTPTGRNKQWNDVCAVRVGTEYKVTDPLALRLGFAYDPTPAPFETTGAELPDANRLNYMVGAGYKIGPLTLDASYFYLQKKNRTLNNVRLEENGNPIGMNGMWKGTAHLVSLDLGYKF